MRNLSVVGVFMGALMWGRNESNRKREIVTGDFQLVIQQYALRGKFAHKEICLNRLFYIKVILLH